MYFTTIAHIARHTDASVAVDALVEHLDETLPGWEHDEQVGTRFIRESDLMSDLMDDDGFAEAYDAWREDTFDPDFPW